ncbi:MAG: hypothetical protein JWP81_4347 [Ferruginibacter sp.]|nr:hypothetical protein [Ferruginibacter sp.]
MGNISNQPGRLFLIIGAVFGRATLLLQLDLIVVNRTASLTSVFMGTAGITTNRR